MKNILQKTKQSLAIGFLSLDTKITKLIPNPKVKKIAYIGIGSLFGFMLLIIILGLLLSPFRNQNVDTRMTQNKPNIIITSPEPPVELSSTEKLILNLETRIKEMKFPESILNIPVIKMDITI